MHLSEPAWVLLTVDVPVASLIDGTSHVNVICVPNKMPFECMLTCSLSATAGLYMFEQ